MVLKKIYNNLIKKNSKDKEETEVNFKPFNEGAIICYNCGSHHLLTFFKPLSFAKCSKCNSPMFIPHKVSDYWLFKPLGSGGMGSVYKAVHYMSGRKYAVKLLQRDSKTDPSVVKSLLNEGEVGSLFSEHPNICSVVDYGIVENEVYLISDFIDGIRLDILVDKDGPVKEENVLLWGLQLLSALQHIYKKGYLFKDMKPQNIVISYNMKKVFLFDFGLTTDINEQYKQGQNTVMGSPIFLPPERMSLSKENMSSEIYSLGMVAFYCLAGKPYYSSDDIDEIIKMHTRKMRMKSVASQLPNGNPDIINIIEKMIKRNPTERYQSFEEVYHEIKAIYEVYRF